MEHGVSSLRELEQRGVGQSELRTLLREGTLTRLRRGWYAERGHANPDVEAAVRRGGVLTCRSALHLHGVWVLPEHSAIHARAKPNIHRANPSAFCRQHGPPECEVSAVDDLATSLRHAVRCLDNEGIVAACDSILNKRLMSVDELEYTLRNAPVRVRRLLNKCEPGAQSGIETLARLRFRARGLKVKTQVYIPTVGYVDLLIGDRFIFECDGRAFHSAEEMNESDRERDRHAAALGYERIRASYNQVIYQWPQVEADAMSIVARGRHMWPRQRT